MFSSRNALAPYLYRLEWVDHDTGSSFPLYRHDTLKWGYLVPTDHPHKGAGPHFYTLADGTTSTTHRFFKLPHKNGESSNCGNPLTKDFMRYVKNNTLRSQNMRFAKAMQNSGICSYWASTQARITSQFVVWEELVTRQALLGTPPGST